MSQADSACCCRELSRATSKVTHERSTCLTFEIIPSLWKPKTGFTLVRSTLPKRSAHPTGFRSRSRKQASGWCRDDLGRSGMKKLHPENQQLLICFLREKRVWLQVPKPYTCFELSSVMTPAFIHAQQKLPEGSQLRRSPAPWPYSFCKIPQNQIRAAADGDVEQSRSNLKSSPGPALAFLPCFYHFFPWDLCSFPIPFILAHPDRFFYICAFNTPQ